MCVFHRCFAFPDLEKKALHILCKTNSNIGGLTTGGPKTGSNRGQNPANMLGELLFFLVFLIIQYGIFGVLIIPKWLIKVPGHIPIFFG